MVNYIDDMKEHEVGVRVRTTLVKDTGVWCQDVQVVTEWEYDGAEGRRVPVAHWEEGDDLKERFTESNRTALDCIEDCACICRELKNQGVRRLAHVNIDDLLLDCEDWGEETLDVEQLTVDS